MFDVKITIISIPISIALIAAVVFGAFPQDFFGPQYVTLTGSFTNLSSGLKIGKLTFINESGANVTANLTTPYTYSAHLANHHSYGYFLEWSRPSLNQTGVISGKKFSINSLNTTYGLDIPTNAPQAFVNLAGTASASLLGIGTVPLNITFTNQGGQSFRASVTNGTYQINIENLETYSVSIQFSRDIAIFQQSVGVCNVPNEFHLNATVGTTNVKKDFTCPPK